MRAAQWVYLRRPLLPRCHRAGWLGDAGAYAQQVWAKLVEVGEQLVAEAEASDLRRGRASFPDRPDVWAAYTVQVGDEHAVGARLVAEEDAHSATGRRSGRIDLVVVTSSRKGRAASPLVGCDVVALQCGVARERRVQQQGDHAIAQGRRQQHDRGRQCLVGRRRPRQLRDALRRGFSLGGGEIIV